MAGKVISNLIMTRIFYFVHMPQSCIFIKFVYMCLNFSSLCGFFSREENQFNANLCELPNLAGEFVRAIETIKRPVACVSYFFA